MRRSSLLAGYALAGLFTIASTALALAGRNTWGPSATYAFFLAAVMLSSWHSGVGPGLLSTLLGTLAADYFLLTPIHSETFDLSRAIHLSAFVLVSVFISSLNDARRRALTALEVERERLEDHVQERTAALLGANEQLRAEIDQRNRAERNVRGLIDSAPDAIVVIALDGRIVTVNAETERLFGYARRQMLGADIDLLFPAGLGTIRHAERSGQDGGPTAHALGGERFARRADGTECPVDIRVSTLEAEEGLLSVCAVRDVSERYDAQRMQVRLLHDLGVRVKELTALHRAARLLNEDGAGIEVLTRIVELLPTAWQYPAITVARIAVGERDVRSPGFRETTWMQRATFTTPDGEHGLIEVAYLEERPPEAEGPFLAEERRLIESLAGLLRAWFERLRAEQNRLRLTRAEAARLEAQQANQAKDEFLATLSHELRAPLNVMLGWTRMLRSGALEDVSTARGLEVLERSVTLQARLIEDLLEVSRIVTGKLRLDRQRFDASGVAGVAVEAARPAAHAKGLRFAAAIDAGLWMDGDPARLQQIISNLLTNAVKFTPDGGVVEVRLARDGHDARLLVRDSGIGIEPDLLPFVFDRFRQGDTSTTRSHGGLGLGLAIVRHLVELHGGRIEASSAGRDAGATFTVTLPLAPDAMSAGSGASTAAEDPLLAGIRVLVVDDDADARMTTIARLVRGRAGMRS